MSVKIVGAVLGRRPPSRPERRLAKSLAGEARFDAFARGRYATDASIYQIMPAGVVFPKHADDVAATLAIAREEGVPVIARGGGTSQNGQPIGAGLVLDFSREFNRVERYDPVARTATVSPGLVLEHLNTRLKADGLFFPVEPSTASRCTIGGMTGNNSCGARSIRYGKMVDNVLAVEGFFHDGERFGFGPSERGANDSFDSDRARSLADTALGIAHRERAEIEARFPKVQRRVGGYNLDSLLAPQPNLAHLLVGSEGTLALSTAITLKLSALPAHRVMGVCHFPSFRSAMETTRHLVELGPVAVELVDNNVWCSAPTSRCSAIRCRRSPRGSRIACCSSNSPARIFPRCAKRPESASTSAWPITALPTPWSRSLSRPDSVRSGRCARPASTS
jgi:FAD/FMN-containing dehydrogenase